jgi:hypothetical protein
MHPGNADSDWPAAIPMASGGNRYRQLHPSAAPRRQQSRGGRSRRVRWLRRLRRLALALSTPWPLMPTRHDTNCTANNSTTLSCPVFNGGLK